MLYNYTHASLGIRLLSSPAAHDQDRDLLKVILQSTIHVLLIESLVIMQ